MKNRGIFLISAIFILSILINFISADLGPKPTMEFNIQYETSNQITLINGSQYQCEDKDCNNIKRLSEYGPQRFLCNSNSCRSAAYGYSPYQKLILNFSDKQRESQIFYTNAFNAKFNVRVTDSELIVEETTPFASKWKVSSFIKSLIITLILELLVALKYLSKNKLPKKILVSILIGNLITLPIVWFIIQLIITKLEIFILLSEIFAIVFEAYFIYYLNKKKITIKKAFILSIIMNLTSWIIGGFISFISVIT
jgi:hypothetical protein